MSAPVLVVGGYTDRDDSPPGAPAGVAFHERHDGVWRLSATIPIDNPTWFEWDERRRVLYISQSGLTTLTAVRVPGGPDTAYVLDEIELDAVNPAHLALAPAGDAVVAACFTEGQVLTVGIAPDGGFLGVRGRVALGRPGVSEPHQISFGDHGFAVPDRAEDVVHRFSWRRGSAPVLVGADPLPAGRGPRHMARHPARADLAYLAGELDSTVTVLHREDGRFVVGAELSTLPSSFSGENSVAAIFTDSPASRLFVSNRGHDSLAVFDIAQPCSPRREGWVFAGGRTPRFAGEVEDGTIAIAMLDSHRVHLLSDVDGALRGSPRTVEIPHSAPACVRLIGLSP